MAISDSQKVDLLYKKLFGVAKTDLPANKSPSNESIASPHLTRGDQIWQESANIPETAAAVTNIVQAYQTTGRIQCTADTTSTPISSVYPSWKTNLIDWIPPEFGATYFVKVYADNSGASDPTATGTQLSDSGISGVGEWNFDYQSGVLNFIGGTIPAALTVSKVIFIVGYRYIGLKGIASLGNISSNNASITNFSTGNIIISGGYISGLANITANLGNVNSWYAGNLNSTTANITQLTSTNFSSGNVLITGGSISALANANIGNLRIADTTISSLTGNVSIQPLLSNPNAVVIIDSKSALQLPSGTTGEQPTVAATGSIRWNSTNSRVEYYTGTAWAAITGQIDNQVITPDGSSVAYTLDYTSTAEGIIVSINGTLQQPDVAYTVSGTTITFNEIPLTTDIISIRFIASGVSGFAGGEVTGNVYISDTTTSTSTTTGALIVNGGVGIDGGNGNAIVATGNVWISGNILPGPGLVSGTANIGSPTTTYNTIFAKATSSQYADLAENYLSDEIYAPGTVVIIGGNKEITISKLDHDTRVAGVISTNPAYLMNSENSGLPVALTGRVPCQVQGPICKGDLVVASAIPGVARQIDLTLYTPGCVLGKSLETINNATIQNIEILMGRF
jgi:hypothetical protein